MLFDILTDNSFPGADTSVGSGANSTTGVPGLTDLKGNIYNIVSHVASNTRSISPGPIGLNTLYDPTSGSIKNGRVRCWGNTTTSDSEGLTARLTNVAGSITCYSVAASKSALTFYFYKIVAGTRTTLATIPFSNFPTGAYVFEMIVLSVNSSSSQILLNLYAASDLTTVIATASVTDATATLQVAGYWGHCGLSGCEITRLQISNENATLDASPTRVVNIYRTKASLQGTASTGGSEPKTVQWQSAAATGSFSNISGATTVALSLTSLTAGSTQRYRMVTTDNLGATVMSPETTVTTATNQHIIMGFVGDSITFGTGASTTLLCAAQIMMNTLIAANPGRYWSYFVNIGYYGASAADWASSLTGALKSQLTAAEVDQVQLTLGTNDSKTAIASPKATYKSNISTITTGLMTGTTVTSVRLNQPPWVNPATATWDANSNVLLAQYSAAEDELANGTTLLVGDRTAQAHFQAFPAQLGDGVHPNDAGHAWLGGAWAIAELAVRTIPQLRTGGQLSGFIKTGGNL